MIVIVVQARMGSTRLPGKVLMPIAGRPMLSYLIERLRRVRGADRIVIATSTLAQDDAIASAADDLGIGCTRGSESDVLARFAQAAREFSASTVVRVTADCPLIDPALIDLALVKFRETVPKPDYVSNMLEPTWPYGMAVEVVSAEVLLQADREARDPAEREHVTPFVYRHPERFRLLSLTMTPDLSRQRWTVDTPEDFELVSRILSTIYPRRADFDMRDVLDLLAANPSWAAINSHVVQKTVTTDHSGLTQ